MTEALTLPEQVQRACEESKAVIVVIGAGVAGLEAALALARHGIESLLVERSARAGGRAATYSCKALEEECQACGACLAGQKLAEVLECPLVRLRLHTEVQSAERAEGGFRVRLRQGDSQEEVLAQGVIVTVGFTPVFPARRGEFGYGHLAGVITALEAEAILQDTPEAFAPGAQVAFVQCAGSRDPAAGIPYCSRACCLYVPKLARLLAAVSGAQADVYFMDRQSYPPVYRDGNQGLRYLRGMPSRVFPLADGRLEIRCAGPGGDQPRPRAYDWVVLCPAMTPAAGGA
ncbi:MAG: NAD(P)-binding protein, partial [Syntrophomonadaceae bacterium]|nr:NAD(P)-binding protein [Syntrophomonadaceae bacterium]